MGSRFWPAATLPILVFLQIIPWVTGQYNIIPPDNPVIGIVGNGAILPCQLQGKIIPEKLSIQWIFSGSSAEKAVATFDGKNPRNPFLEFEGYQGRTEFFPSEFHWGNLSLVLKNIRPSDKGKYTCVIFLESWYNEVMVELDVAAQGAESSIFLDGHSGNGINLSCRSQGWFPAPSVVWLDSQGQTRPEEVTTRSTPDPSSSIFDVVSSMSLEPGSDQEVSCRVVNKVLNATRESRVQIADSFFPSPSPWMFASLAILGLDLGIIGAIIAIAIKRKHLERLRAELGFWEARSHAVPVVLDTKAWFVALQGMHCMFWGLVLVARDALGAGKHYWEVKLRREKDWVLGVLLDRSSLPRQHFWNSQDCWALRGFSGKLYYTGGPKVGEKGRGLSVVGVFLDSEKERLEFYDVKRMRLVVGVSLVSGMDPEGKFFPFVSQRSLQIRPVPIPVPLEKHRGV